MTTMAPTQVTTQVYRVYIKASAQAVWDAITEPEWTERYGFGGRTEGDMQAGGSFRVLTSDAIRSMGFPDVALEGKVIESDPPRKLVLSTHNVVDESMAAEGVTRTTYEIEESQKGVTKLTVIHDLEGAPKLALLLSGGLEEQGAGGGWNWILSDLKSLLETGEPLAKPFGQSRPILPL